MLLVLLPAVVQAQFTFATNNGTITITGYFGSGGTAAIPSTITGRSVTSIGNSAFYNQSSLTNVTIPNSVTNIGYMAFCSCISLTSVTIPTNVASIGSEAFSSCNSLTNITVDALNSVYSSVDGVLFNKSQTTLTQYPGGKAGNYAIPNSVTSVAGVAFAGCTRLTNITIGNSVTTIEHGAFAHCTNLTSVAIGNSVINLGVSAFESCTGLTNVTIGNNVTSIEGGVFQSCTALTSVTFGNSVTNIGRGAFGYCYNLSSVIIPDSVNSIEDDAFFACSSLTNIVIPFSVAYIGRAFASCSRLSGLTVDTLNSVYSSFEGVLFNKSQTTLIQYPGGKAGNYTIPNSVTTIVDWAFGTCTNLTSVTIPDSVTNLGIYAFNFCSSLTSVTVGSSVTNIGSYTFQDCASLTGVYFKGNAPSVDMPVFDGDNSVTVYYLPGTTGWHSPFGGRPAVLWNPKAQTNNVSFGVQTNQFGFNITGSSNLVIVVEACTNLVNPVWSPVSTNMLDTFIGTNGTSYFSDSQWAIYPARFYRLRSP
ncbi:MAG: leucine-rich repeat domain-containing protein [Verrucomicrobia bacterium]|nr:leucine-rich repeat domain-containing protein [Verrucomicrobiota bacterium]